MTTAPLASTPIVNTAPVAYLVAERRPWTGNPNWIFGDEWNAWADNQAEAELCAEQWRRYSAADDVAVFAVVPITLGGRQ